MPAPESPAVPARDRLVRAMRDALQRRGLHGVGLAEILAQAQAPKGVLYHHFPGGKNELAVASVMATADSAAAALDRLLARHADPLAALDAWIAGALAQLEASGFERGCPLATVALESTAGDGALRDALAQAFERLRGHIAGALQRAGHDADAAAGLAALIVSAYEGGLLQARVAHSAAPLVQASRTLRALIQPRGQPRGEP